MGRRRSQDSFSRRMPATPRRRRPPPNRQGQVRRRLALGSRRHLNPELIHHTDPGSPYTADDHPATLRSKQVLIRMSKKGDPLDNAMMESFFSTLRAELTELQHFHTRRQARTALFEFIEGFYNRQLLHSSLGYHSPTDFEAAHSIP